MEAMSLIDGDEKIYLIFMSFLMIVSFLMNDKKWETVIKLFLIIIVIE
jgi:hypothetical protein